VACLLGSAGALMLLPYAGPAGQVIVGGAGLAVAGAAFAFGRMISLRRPGVRRIGFLALGLAAASAVLFALLAVARPEAAAYFLAWLAVHLAYAGFALHRLVRWPTGEMADEPPVALGIFISYRRDDSRETVGRLHDALSRGFDPACIFLDVAGQVPGEDYRTVIGRALDAAEVVLVVIGPRWLDITDAEGRRRLDDPEDMVRIEVESALQRGKQVIPVLVQGATMPADEALPATLVALAFRMASPLRPDPDFRTDLLRLVDALRAHAQGRPD
jgi:hypothetical protein